MAAAQIQCEIADTRGNPVGHSSFIGCQSCHEAAFAALPRVYTDRCGRPFCCDEIQASSVLYRSGLFREKYQLATSRTRMTRKPDIARVKFGVAVTYYNSRVLAERISCQDRLYGFVNRLGAWPVNVQRGLISTDP